ncbi:hypothetical protein PMAYCL1PPCAC_07435, partial [Pristionchus mayeri]
STFPILLTSPLLTQQQPFYNDLIMGAFYSKPENRHVRDRIRLCDGLKPLFSSTVAAAGNGRYVFILGEKSIRILTDGTTLTTFKLDYIDLMFSTRTRLECVGGFSNFGMLVGFYALDVRTVVLIDFNDPERTMRQRLISIDAKNRRTFAWLDRGYRLNNRALFFIGRTAVSEDRVITIAPSLTGRFSPLAIVYPKNPLNLGLPVLNISSLLVEAGNRVHEMAPQMGNEERVNLSAWDAPFFLSPTKIGFFTDRSGILTVDPSLMIVCDIDAQRVSIERSKPDETTNFPYTKERSHPFDCRSFSGSRNSLGLVVSHRCPPIGWRRTVGAITERLANWSFYAFIILAERQWPWLSTRFLSFSIFLGLLKYKIVRPPGARIGVMDTRTLQWKEQIGAADPSNFTCMKTSVFSDGQTLIYDQVTEKRMGTRDLGDNFDREPTEELRVLANPGRVASLKTLSEMRLRRNVIRRSELEEISARI